MPQLTTDLTAEQKQQYLNLIRQANPHDMVYRSILTSLDNPFKPINELNDYASKRTKIDISQFQAITTPIAQQQINSLYTSASHTLYICESPQDTNPKLLYTTTQDPNSFIMINMLCAQWVNNLDTKTDPYVSYNGNCAGAMIPRDLFAACIAGGAYKEPDIS